MAVGKSELIVAGVVAVAVLVVALVWMAQDPAPPANPSANKRGERWDILSHSRAAHPGRTLAYSETGKRFEIGGTDDDWRLPSPGRGSFTFKCAKKGGGLVVGLHPDLRAQDGAAIVLDTGDVEYQKSYVGIIPNHGGEAPGSKVNTKWQMPPGMHRYWVSVNNGFIAIGEGSVIGEKTIVSANVPGANNSPPLQFFSFGTVDRSLGVGHIEDIRVSRLHAEEPKQQYAMHDGRQIPLPHAAMSDRDIFA